MHAGWTAATPLEMLPACAVIVMNLASLKESHTRALELQHDAVQC